MFHALEFAIDTQHGIVTRREVHIGGLLLKHQVEE
jgi:hypothetical protein